MDLRELLEQFATAGVLRSIRTTVDPDLELAALCRREFARGNGSALLFEHLIGCEFRCAANLFGSDLRLAKILRCADYRQLGEKLRAALQAQSGTASERLCKLSKSAAARSDMRTPLWQRHAATLRQLPALRSWPQETRPYFTLPLVLSRHPLTGVQNLGMYRVQIQSDQQAAINILPDSGAGEHLAAAVELGRRLPVALVFGSDPALCWLGAAPLPPGCDEYGLFRRLFGDELPLTLGSTQQLLVPSNAEFVVEGFIPPGQTCLEGPFGNHSGCYASRVDCPVLQVTSIAWREQAIMPVTVVGPPPNENVYLGRANETLIRELLRIDFPEISDLRLPVLTLFHGAALVQVGGSGFQDGRDLIERLWDNSPLHKSKLLVLCDADIDLAHSELVFWRLVNRLDSRRLYSQGQQLAIDATGVDPKQLVVEDRATAELIERRRNEYDS